MNDDDPIDFTPLDPSRDAARWDRAIAGVVARATAARKPSVLRELQRTGVVVLALAAAAAAAMWLGRRPGAPPAVSRDPITEWTRWASGEAVDPLSLVDERSESSGVGALPASPVGRGRSPLGIDSGGVP